MVTMHFLKTDTVSILDRRVYSWRLYYTIWKTIYQKKMERIHSRRC